MRADEERVIATGSSDRARGVVELVVDEQHETRVLREGVARATFSIDIMTADLKAAMLPDAATHRASSTLALLRKLAGRGVEVRLLHAGVPSGAVLHELRQAALPPNLAIRRCPRLHSKAVVIDAQLMYLGSANLTGAGLGAKGATRRNFEMGVWTDASTLIDEVLARFNTLWEGHECANCGRRDICPVPLEAPDLARKRA